MKFPFLFFFTGKKTTISSGKETTTDFRALLNKVLCLKADSSLEVEAMSV